MVVCSCPLLAKEQRGLLTDQSTSSVSPSGSPAVPLSTMALPSNPTYSPPAPATGALLVVETDHSSRPLDPSSAVNSSVSPSSLIDCGFEPAEGLMSDSRMVVAPVPALRQSSCPCAPSSARK